LTVIQTVTFGEAWSHLLESLYNEGTVLAPRGIYSRELTDVTLRFIDPYENILVNGIRRPSYRFMVAEWLWIWFGREDVASISKYNPHISQFSNDGVSFDGAYGPMVRKQWLRVLHLLRKDSSTRQAVIQIYRPQSLESRDVPCTLSLQFLLRYGKLHTIANMRSSDIWLGLPYDAFNFTMLANILAAQLGVELGPLTFHLGSSHLYEVNGEHARQVINDKVETIRSPQLPSVPPAGLEEVLTTRESKTFDRPWSMYNAVLVSPTNADALKALVA